MKSPKILSSTQSSLFNIRNSERSFGKKNSRKSEIVVFRRISRGYILYQNWELKCFLMKLDFRTFKRMNKNPWSQFLHFQNGVNLKKLFEKDLQVLFALRRISHNKKWWRTFLIRDLNLIERIYFRSKNFWSQLLNLVLLLIDE